MTVDQGECRSDLENESKTVKNHDQLIEALVNGLSTTRAQAAPAQVNRAVLIGGTLSLIVLLLTLGVQPNLGNFGHMVPLVIKIGYAMSIAAFAWQLAILEARPDRHFGKAFLRLTVPLSGITLIATGEMLHRSGAEAIALVTGHTWAACPLWIMFLAVPVFAAMVHAMRIQAPTNLRAAGATVGLLSGAVSASIYALACIESSAGFVLLWYSAGLAATTLVGTMVGPYLLRW